MQTKQQACPHISFTYTNCGWSFPNALCCYIWVKCKMEMELLKLFKLAQTDPSLKKQVVDAFVQSGVLLYTHPPTSTQSFSLLFVNRMRGSHATQIQPFRPCGHRPCAQTKRSPSACFRCTSSVAHPPFRLKRRDSLSMQASSLHPCQCSSTPISIRARSAPLLSSSLLCACACRTVGLIRPLLSTGVKQTTR